MAYSLCRTCNWRYRWYLRVLYRTAATMIITMNTADIVLITAASMMTLRLSAFRTPETRRPSREDVTQQIKLFSPETECTHRKQRI